MISAIARFVMLATVFAPLAAAAEPIRLKLAYFTSDQARFYNLAVKPFVDAVNADARGDIKIETYPNGSLGKDEAQQAQLVRDNVADIAFVVLGPTGNQFPGHSVMELPGLFRDLRESTLVHTRMMASGIMEGYGDFFVLGAFATEPQSIHMRPLIGTLDDLKGKKIRANNSIEAGLLARLGMYPVVMPVGKAAEAINRGTIDGAATATPPLIDFGLGRAVTYHYFLHLGSSVTTILMNRKKFESLPKVDQDVIREYSGEWIAARYIEGFEPYIKKFLEQLKSDPKRTVIVPSQADLETARVAFKAVIDDWLATSPHNRELLKAVEAEIGKVRSAR